MDQVEHFRGCLLGLAVGDAIGATVEGCPRGSFKPLDDMVGGGPFGLKAGEWTDDTSMALCLASSLVECNGFDADDQMRRYCLWADTGYFSSNGRCFDIGRTVATALKRYRKTGNPFSGPVDPYSAGNGCIMRLAPIPMFFFPDVDMAEHYARESSRTTHGAVECIDACRLQARVICRALLGCSKNEVLLGDRNTFVGSKKITAVANGAYLEKDEADIRGSGYVVETLEAAMWCFARAESFKEAVLMAVNLGDDADTTGAVCGQIAGAYYGANAIPKAWIERLALRETIIGLADRLYDAARKRAG